MSQRLGQSKPLTTTTGSGLECDLSSFNQGKSLDLVENAGRNGLTHSSWRRMRKPAASCGRAGSHARFMRGIKLTLGKAVWRDRNTLDSCDLIDPLS